MNLYSTKGGTAVYIVQYINKRRRTSITGLQYDTVYMYVNTGPIRDGIIRVG